MFINRLNELFEHTFTAKDVPVAFRDGQVMCQLMNLCLSLQQLAQVSINTAATPAAAEANFSAFFARAKEFGLPEALVFAPDTLSTGAADANLIRIMHFVLGNWIGLECCQVDEANVKPEEPAPPSRPARPSSRPVPPAKPSLPPAKPPLPTSKPKVAGPPRPAQKPAVSAKPQRPDGPAQSQQPRGPRPRAAPGSANSSRKGPRPPPGAWRGPQRPPPPGVATGRSARPPPGVTTGRNGARPPPGTIGIRGRTNNQRRSNRQRSSPQPPRQRSSPQPPRQRSPARLDEKTLEEQKLLAQQILTRDKPRPDAVKPNKRESTGARALREQRELALRLERQALEQQRISAFGLAPHEDTPLPPVPGDASPSPAKKMAPAPPAAAKPAPAAKPKNIAAAVFGNRPPPPQQPGRAASPKPARPLSPRASPHRASSPAAVDTPPSVSKPEKPEPGVPKPAAAPKPPPSKTPPKLAAKPPAAAPGPEAASDDADAPLERRPSAVRALAEKLGDIYARPQPPPKAASGSPPARRATMDASSEAGGDKGSGMLGFFKKRNTLRNPELRLQKPSSEDLTGDEHAGRHRPIGRNQTIDLGELSHDEAGTDDDDERHGSFTKALTSKLSVFRKKPRSQDDDAEADHSDSSAAPSANGSRSMLGNLFRKRSKEALIEEQPASDAPPPSDEAEVARPASPKPAPRPRSPTAKPRPSSTSSAPDETSPGGSSSPGGPRPQPKPRASPSPARRPSSSDLSVTPARRPSSSDLGVSPLASAVAEAKAAGAWPPPPPPAKAKPAPPAAKPATAAKPALTQKPSVKLPPPSKPPPSLAGAAATAPPSAASPPTAPKPPPNKPPPSLSSAPAPAPRPLSTGSAPMPRPLSTGSAPAPPAPAAKPALKPPPSKPPPSLAAAPVEQEENGEDTAETGEYLHVGDEDVYTDVATESEDIYSVPPTAPAAAAVAAAVAAQAAKVKGDEEVYSAVPGGGAGAAATERPRNWPPPPPPKKTLSMISSSSSTDEPAGGPAPERAASMLVEPAPRPNVKVLRAQSMPPDSELESQYTAIRHLDNFEQLQIIATRMMDQVEIKDRKFLMRKFTSCFTAKDAINWLILEKTARDDLEAIQIGNKMIDCDMFHHVQDRDRRFEKGNAMAMTYYRWNEPYRWHHPDEPAPPSPSPDDDEGNAAEDQAEPEHGHLFVVHAFRDPTLKCYTCRKVLGLLKASMQCSRCEVSVHEKCSRTAPTCVGYPFERLEKEERRRSKIEEKERRAAEERERKANEDRERKERKLEKAKSKRIKKQQQVEEKAERARERAAAAAAVAEEDAESEPEPESDTEPMEDLSGDEGAGAVDEAFAQDIQDAGGYYAEDGAWVSGYYTEEGEWITTAVYVMDEETNEWVCEYEGDEEGSGDDEMDDDDDDDWDEDDGDTDDWDDDDELTAVNEGVSALSMPQPAVPGPVKDDFGYAGHQAIYEEVPDEVKADARKAPTPSGDTFTSTTKAGLKHDDIYESVARKSRSSQEEDIYADVDRQEEDGQQASTDGGGSSGGGGGGGSGGGPARSGSMRKGLHDIRMALNNRPVSIYGGVKLPVPGAEAFPEPREPTPDAPDAGPITVIFRSQNKLWKEQPHVVASGLLDTLDKQAIKRQEAIFELGYSEEAYLKDVQALNKVFLLPLEAHTRAVAFKGGEPMINRDLLTRLSQVGF